MAEQYLLQGEFDIKQILDAFRKLEEVSKKTGKTIDEVLLNDKEAQDFVKGLDIVKKKSESIKPVEIFEEGQIELSHRAEKRVERIYSSIGELGARTRFLVGDIHNGVISLASSVPQFADMMFEASYQLQKSGVSFSQGLKMMFIGEGGIMLALTAAMAIVDIFKEKMQETKKATEEEIKAFEELMQKYKEAPAVLIEQAVTSNAKYIESLNKQLDEIEKRKKVVIETKYIHGEPVDIQKVVYGRKEDEELEKRIRKQLEFAEKEQKGALNQLEERKQRIQAILNTHYSTDYPKAELERALKVLQNEIENGDKKLRKLYTDKAKSLQILIDKINEEMSVKSDVKKPVEEKKNSDEKLKEIEKYYETVKFADNSYFEYRRSKIEEEKKKVLEATQNNLRAQIYYNIELKKLIDERKKWEEEQKPKPTLMYGAISKEGIDKQRQKVEEDIVDATKDETHQVNLLGAVWQRTGNVMVNYLTKSVGLLNDANNLAGQLANVLVQMALTFLTGGIAGSIAGGDFVTAGLSAIGVTKFAEGGAITEPTIAIGKSGRVSLIGEAGTEYIIPKNRLFDLGNVNNSSNDMFVNIKVEGMLKGEGDELVSIFKRKESFIKRKR